MEPGLDARASFWRRVAATLVDYPLTAVASAAIAIGVFALLLPHVYTQTAWNLVLASALLLPSGLLFVYRWVANSMGGTIGKRIVGVRVVRAGSDHNSGLGTGFIRTVLAIVSGLPIGLGYLWAAWDREGKTWHDKAAGTSVIRQRSSRPGRLLLISGVGVVGLSTAVALAFVQVNGRVRTLRIEGASMEPTFHNNQLLTAVKHGQPGRGDLIAFRFPLDPSRDFIKRVIGVPGDTVEVKNQTVFINGSPLKEDYIKDTPNDTYAPKTVPRGMYYVLGDNRRNSFDSHAWGNSCSPQQLCDFVPEENIIGQILR
jgi:signal peptidase I